MSQRIAAFFLTAICFGCFACPISVEAGWFSSSVERVMAQKAAQKAAAKQATEKAASRQGAGKSMANKTIGNEVAIEKVAEKKAVAKKAARQFEEGRISEKAKNKALMSWDQARDKIIQVKPTEKPKTVYRYTSKRQAKTEQANGIAPNTHMTSKEAGAGRPLSAATSKERYGLSNEPQARMKIEIPANQPVRKAKVIGGQAGYGEITSPRRIPPKSVVDVRPML